ncbi:hypothetical protein HPQ64_04605 [Rhizobiales bacterium]|uniref:hypothetical protein n=1 Tax=Hongsoonwoonella zoysiae TaxID=2821844 RepID=UPI00155FED3D|nr:hypothetical protein [Hongsoonwoonella zoysiae]NRG16961.1 hypothetical protein [Hongsoonwoonella zoysiae]
MTSRDERHRQKVEEAKRALEAVHRDSDTIGQSALARTANRVRDHFAAQDKEEDDPIEVWGSRIGRLAGLIFAIGLVIYLAVTYL